MEDRGQDKEESPYLYKILDWCSNQTFQEDGTWINSERKTTSIFQHERYKLTLKRPSCLHLKPVRESNLQTLVLCLDMRCVCTMLWCDISLSHLSMLAFVEGNWIFLSILAACSSAKHIIISEVHSPYCHNIWFGKSICKSTLHDTTSQEPSEILPIVAEDDELLHPLRPFALALRPVLFLIQLQPVCGLHLLL